MNLGKITEILQGLLNSDQTRVRQRETAINDLLEKLRKKEAKYLAKIPLAETKKEAKKLKRQLAVCQAQISKGVDALEGK